LQTLNNSDVNRNRVQLQYLSGTVSYVLRTVHEFFFGVNYGYNGLTLKPCVPKAFGNCFVEFEYLGKKFKVEYKPADKKQITVNGKTSCVKEVFIPDADMQEENLITVEY